MKTWKTNLEETKQRYINWWNHKGIILSMWEHFQEEQDSRFLLFLIQHPVHNLEYFLP